MRIVIRTDAAMHIGTGHVMRCLTLANALANKGMETLFICREHDGHLAEAIRNNGHQCKLLPSPTATILDEPDPEMMPPYAGWLGESWETDLQQTRKLIPAAYIDWLIVDHYALDQQWEKGMRDMAGHILVIDDLADRLHDCDILLDQTLGRSQDEYQERVPKKCRILAGVQYALLRTEFREWRPYSLERRQKPALKKLLVNMGGIDAHNMTSKVLHGLVNARESNISEITVVLGMSAPHLSTVTALAESMQVPVNVMVNANNMAELMAKSDLAIGAAGSTVWERCCLGLPAIMIILAKNQELACERLVEEGAAILLNAMDELAQCINDLANNVMILGEMSITASRLVDGNGCSRVIDALFRGQ